MIPFSLKVQKDLKSSLASRKTSFSCLLCVSNANSHHRLNSLEPVSLFLPQKNLVKETHEKSFLSFAHTRQLPTRQKFMLKTSENFSKISYNDHDS